MIHNRPNFTKEPTLWEEPPSFPEPTTDLGRYGIPGAQPRKIIAQTGFERRPGLTCEKHTSLINRPWSSSSDVMLDKEYLSWLRATGRSSSEQTARVWQDWFCGENEWRRYKRETSILSAWNWPWRYEQMLKIEPQFIANHYREVDLLIEYHEGVSPFERHELEVAPPFNYEATRKTLRRAGVAGILTLIPGTAVFGPAALFYAGPILGAWGAIVAAFESRYPAGAR